MREISFTGQMIYLLFSTAEITMETRITRKGRKKIKNENEVGKENKTLSIFR